MILILGLMLYSIPLQVQAQTSQGFEWSYSDSNRYFFYVGQEAEGDAFDFLFYADINTTGVEITDPIEYWEDIPYVPTSYNLTIPGDGELDFVEALMNYWVWSPIVPIGNWTHLALIIENKTSTQFGEGVVGISPMIEVNDDFHFGYNFTFQIEGFEYIVRSHYFKSDGVLSLWDLTGYDSEGSLYGHVRIVRDNTPPTTTYPDDLVIESGSTGNTLTWSLYDNSSSYYMISLDDISYLNGTWDGGNYNLTIPLDALELGVHRFNASFHDAGGNSTFDIVLVEIIDTTSPIIDAPEDIVFQEGTDGHSIVWTPQDFNPVNYEIYQNDILVQEGEWDGGQISYNIDGLTMGSYNYTIIVYDVRGFSATDSVLVDVTMSTSTMVLIGGGVGGIALLGTAVALKRR
ncbi:MAG: hypothetical protein ACFFF4_03735 [Candidatus Thorarchaeota archaeon]